MFNMFFTELFSAQDNNQILEAKAKLEEAGIATKVMSESTQGGMPNMYSADYKGSPLDYDDSAYGRIYTLMVKKKDLDKACELLSLKKTHK